MLDSIIDKMIMNSNHRFEYIINSLKLVNPLNILSKGYSLVKIDDKVIKSVKDIKINDEVNIKLYEGEIKAKVMEVNDGK